MDRENMAAAITVLNVEQGQGKYGCQPRGVQLLFVESSTIEGKPNLEYLRSFLEAQGFQVKEGAPVEGVPFLRLCVTKAQGQLTRAEMLALLEKNPQLDLSKINRSDSGQEQA